MITEKTMRDNHKQYHDDITAIYYDGTMGMTKIEFDQLHGQNWEYMDEALIDNGYRIKPEPSRNLLAEIDELKARLVKAKVI